MPLFDIALVGAGPSAYAGLVALRGFSGSVAVLTGATPDNRKHSHAKIASVAFERRKDAGLADCIRFGGGAPDVFAAAEVGGFANFWGQQLLRYDTGEPWGAGVALPTWRDYLAACDEVESYLRVQGGEIAISENEGPIGLEISTPRLLVGTREMPDSGLNGMAHAARAVIADLGDVHVSPARVHRILPAGNALRLELSGGSDLRARRVFLAAGVLGTGTLLTRSLSDTENISFLDHVPYMLKTMKLGRALDQVSVRPDGNFNTLTLKRRVRGRCELFGSVYAMSAAPLSLLTASLGLGPRLRAWRPGRLVDIVRPIQLWTPKTFSRCEYSIHRKLFEADAAPSPEDDLVLKDFRGWLNRRRVMHSLTTTQAGQGFHYHGLTFGQTRTPVDQVLADVFKGRVHCIDASVLAEIGCPPHTLTMMAQAFGRVRHALAYSI